MLRIEIIWLTDVNAELKISVHKLFILVIKEIQKQFRLVINKVVSRKCCIFAVKELAWEPCVTETLAVLIILTEAAIVK